MRESPIKRQLSVRKFCVFAAAKICMQRLSNFHPEKFWCSKLYCYKEQNTRCGIISHWVASAKIKNQQWKHLKEVKFLIFWKTFFGKLYNTIQNLLAHFQHLLVRSALKYISKQRWLKDNIFHSILLNLYARENVGNILPQ